MVRSYCSDRPVLRSGKGCTDIRSTFDHIIARFQHWVTFKVISGLSDVGRRNRWTVTVDRKLKRRRRDFRKSLLNTPRALNVMLRTRKQPGKKAGEETRGQSWRRMRGRDADEGLPDAALLVASCFEAENCQVNNSRCSKQEHLIGRIN